MSYHYRPTVLVICDGWGVAPDSPGNALTQAALPNFNQYIRQYPVMTLYASGMEVGLMPSEMGNSEVGHLNIGAGRIYYQSLPRLNEQIASGAFFTNPVFQNAATQVTQHHSALHLVGLVSAGNVHAATTHLYALLEFARRNGLQNNVYVHAILDGRDTVYNSGESFIAELLAKMQELGVGSLATISGRYYAMDRDNRWDRCQKAYDAMVLGHGDSADDPLAAIRASYEKKIYDEEFVPTVITQKGKPTATVNSGDAVIFFNFRPDRARQLTQAFVLPSFSKFERHYLKELFFATMTEYEKDLPVAVAYPPMIITNSLAEVISKAGLKQIHIAETEKYAHVTFFLNGALENPFPGEDRVLVPSPGVASYAQAPEMSAAGIAKEAIKVIDKGGYDFVVLNFANADMVGHTGNVAATITGCQAIDKAWGDVVEHTLAKGGVLVMTADHGNAEEVLNLQTGEIDKEHSTNPVPLLIIGKEFMGQAGSGGDAPEGDLSLLPPVGVLADVAPTILKLMGLAQPPEMRGQALM